MAARPLVQPHRQKRPRTTSDVSCDAGAASYMVQTLLQLANHIERELDAAHRTAAIATFQEVLHVLKGTKKPPQSLPSRSVPPPFKGPSNPFLPSRTSHTDSLAAKRRHFRQLRLAPTLAAEHYAHAGLEAAVPWLSSQGSTYAATQEQPSRQCRPKNPKKRCSDVISDGHDDVPDLDPCSSGSGEDTTECARDFSPSVVCVQAGKPAVSRLASSVAPIICPLDNHAVSSHAAHIPTEPSTAVPQSGVPPTQAGSSSDALAHPTVLVTCTPPDSVPADAAIDANFAGTATQTRVSSSAVADSSGNPSVLRGAPVLAAPTPGLFSTPSSSMVAALAGLPVQTTPDSALDTPEYPVSPIVSPMCDAASLATPCASPRSPKSSSGSVPAPASVVDPTLSPRSTVSTSEGLVAPISDSGEHGVGASSLTAPLQTPPVEQELSATGGEVVLACQTADTPVSSGDQRSTSALGPSQLGQPVLPNGEPDTIASIRSAYHEQLTQTEFTISISNKPRQQRFTEKEAIELTSFFFDDLMGSTALDRIRTLVSDYQTIDDSYLPAHAIAKADRLAIDNTLPLALQQFYSALSSRQRFIGLKDNQLYSVLGLIECLRINSAFLTLVEKASNGDEAVIKAAAVAGFRVRRGVGWPSCMMKFLAYSLDVKEQTLKTSCTNYQGVAQLVDFFGNGIIPTLPSNTTYKTLRWGKQRFKTALEILQHHVPVLSVAADMLEKHVLTPIAQGSPITLHDKFLTGGVPFLTLITKAPDLIRQ